MTRTRREESHGDCPVITSRGIACHLGLNSSQPNPLFMRIPIERALPSLSLLLSDNYDYSSTADTYNLIFHLW